uniref:Uncharacterized protein n=1 Tax=Panagrolaimus sp. ES5 TaxID=591445 RepID=A0AC34GJT1_9BILA
TCFKLNNEYRDVRLSTAGKLKEIQSFVDLTEEYQRLHPQSDLTELKLPHSINDVKTFLSDFDEYDSKKRYAFIRGMDGKYLCSQNGDRPMNRIERPVPLGWEVFCFEELGDSGKIALKSRGKYVSSENGERKMRCNRKSNGESEKFVLIQHGDIYALKGNNGKFISCSAENDSLSCTSSCENDILSDNEKLQMEWISDFADEIKISWKHFDSYLSKLCNDFENAVQEKKK